MLAPDKNILLCCLADRHDCVMSNPAFGGDRVELLDHGINSSDFNHFILRANMLDDGSRRDEQPGSRLAKGLHQRTVVKLANDARPNIVGFKPLQQLRAYGDVFSRQQKRRFIE